MSPKANIWTQRDMSTAINNYLLYINDADSKKEF